MISGILSGAPLWVWPLLVFLLWYGIRASRSRVVPAWSFYALSLLGLLSLNAVRGLDAGGMIWGVFAIAYLVGLVLGQRYQAGVLTAKSGGKVTLKGEWVTLTVLMVIFWMNFVGGMARAISPEIYGSTLFQVIFALIAGLVAGSFLGRALCVLRAPET